MSFFGMDCGDARVQEKGCVSFKGKGSYIISEGGVHIQFQGKGSCIILKGEGCIPFKEKRPTVDQEILTLRNFHVVYFHSYYFRHLAKWQKLFTDCN